MSPLTFLAAWPVAVYLYIYLKAADRIRRKHGHRAYPRYDPLAPESLPREVWQRFSKELPRLESLGFAVAAYLHHAGLPEEDDGSADVYLALLRNEETGDIALVSEFFIRVMHVSSHLRVVAFTRELGGGEAVITSNSRALSVFKPDPRRHALGLPGVEDTNYLYRVHRAFAERRAPGRKGLLPSPGMEVPHLCENESRAIARQVECGYFYVDESRAMCRHTWKGALLLTGKLMYGVRDVRKALRDRRVRATLRSLGLKA
jgi:hypothetical protein